MENNVKVNYEDPRFAEVEEKKQAAQGELRQVYDGLLQSADRFYADQVNAGKDWQAQQTQLQEQQTQNALDQIARQQEQAREGYVREQSAAYTDWQKQSARHGVEAEKLASQGLTATGYGESSRVGMYNAYQNRVAVARAAFESAVTGYENAIREAKLQNNANLAQIAYQALQTQLELSLEGFRYRAELLQDQAQQQAQLEQQYYDRYLDVLAQLNAEQSMAEQIRQFNEKMAEDKRQFDVLHQPKTKYVTAEPAQETTKKELGYGVLDLGYGPINETVLDRLVEAGQVTTANLGGNQYYAKNPYAPPLLNTGYTGLTPKKK